MKGKVKFFDRTKRFGFIVGEDDKEFFVHQSGVEGDILLRDEDAVTFEVEDGERGPKAVHVVKVSDEEKEAA